MTTDSDPPKEERSSIEELELQEQQTMEMLVEVGVLNDREAEREESNEKKEEALAITKQISQDNNASSDLTLVEKEQGTAKLRPVPNSSAQNALPMTVEKGTTMIPSAPTTATKISVGVEAQTDDGVINERLEMPRLSAGGTLQRATVVGAFPVEGSTHFANSNGDLESQQTPDRITNSTNDRDGTSEDVQLYDVSARLVSDNDSDDGGDPVYAVATAVAKEPTKKYKYIAGSVLLAVVLILVAVILATTLSGGANDSSKDDEPTSTSTVITAPPLIPSTQDLVSYEESLQIGNTMIGSAPGDRFGAPLALSRNGDILAVGARENAAVGIDSGMARVFRSSQTSTNNNETRSLWRQYGNALFGQSAYDEFAFSGMAMNANGTRLAIGAVYRNVTTTNGTLLVNAGNVRVFDLIGNAVWQPVGPELQGLNAGDLFGRAVAMSQDGSIVAAASYESSENGFASGNVRVFQYNGSTSAWDPMGQILLGHKEWDRLGRAIELSADGMRLVAGATQFKGEGPGYAQVYGFNGTHWNQVGQDLVGDTEQGLLGRDVAISADGTVVACGANAANTSGLDKSGSLHLYQLNSNDEWIPMGQTIMGRFEGDGLGLAVALSADGKRFAVGASQKKNKTAGGYVLVMDYDETSQRWVQKGQDLKGAEDLGKFGADVRLSANGHVVAVGAIGSDLNGDDSGMVQVFDLTDV